MTHSVKHWRGLLNYSTLTRNDLSSGDALATIHPRQKDGHLNQPLFSTIFGNSGKAIAELSCEVAIVPSTILPHDNVWVVTTTNCHIYSSTCWCWLHWRQSWPPRLLHMPNTSNYIRGMITSHSLSACWQTSCWSEATFSSTNTSTKMNSHGILHECSLIISLYLFSSFCYHFHEFLLVLFCRWNNYFLLNRNN